MQIHTQTHTHMPNMPVTSASHGIINAVAVVSLVQLSITAYIYVYSLAQATKMQRRKKGTAKMHESRRCTSTTNALVCCWCGKRRKRTLITVANIKLAGYTYNTLYNIFDRILAIFIQIYYPFGFVSANRFYFVVCYCCCCRRVFLFLHSGSPERRAIGCCCRHRRSCPNALRCKLYTKCQYYILSMHINMRKWY